MTRIRRTAIVALIGAPLVVFAAPTTVWAANTITDCLAENQGVADIVCHEVTKLPGTPTNGQVKVSWQHVPTEMTALQGGIWMQRAPIKGQRTGVAEYLPDTNSDTLCAQGNGFAACSKTYAGTSGSVILDFPLSSAGYRYIIMGSEKLSNANGEEASADIRDNADNTVVWVNKAYKYKEKGKTVVRRSCPKSMKGKCTPAVLLDVNQDVGTGMPATPLY